MLYVPDINYIVELVVPEGYKLSPKNNPNAETEDRDSDFNKEAPFDNSSGGVNDISSLTDSIEVEKGKYNYFIDAALTPKDGTEPPTPIKLSRLGNRIWNDLNGDGLKQGNEPGFKNVTVNLWIDNDKNGTPDRIIKTDTTDAGGFYFFNALDSAQQYFLQVIRPEGYVFSPKNNPSAASIDKDSDINSDGLSDALNLFPLKYTYWIDAGLVKVTETQPSRIEGTGLVR